MLTCSKPGLGGASVDLVAIVVPKLLRESGVLANNLVRVSNDGLQCFRNGLTLVSTHIM